MHCRGSGAAKNLLYHLSALHFSQTLAAKSLCATTQASQLQLHVGICPAHVALWRLARGHCSTHEYEMTCLVDGSNLFRGPHYRGGAGVGDGCAAALTYAAADARHCNSAQLELPVPTL